MSTSVSATTTGPPLAHLAHVLTQLVRFLGRERPEHRKGALDPLLVFHRRGACGDRQPPKVRGHGNALGPGARARDGELLHREANADRLVAELRLSHGLHCVPKRPTAQPPQASVQKRTTGAPRSSRERYPSTPAAAAKTMAEAALM